MKQVSSKLMVTAAILTLGATAANGEEFLIAKVPFDFRAVRSNLPAGRYSIAPALGGRNVTEIRNLDTGKTVFLSSKLTRGDSDGEARLVFMCGGNDVCSLATMWPESGPGLDIPTPAPTGRRETISRIRIKGK